MEDIQIPSPTAQGGPKSVQSFSSESSSNIFNAQKSPLQTLNHTERRRSIVSIQTEKGKVTPLHPYAGVLLPKHDAEDEDTVFELEQQLDLFPHHDADIKSKLQVVFFRSCTAGDLRKVSYLVKHCAKDIDVNAKDDTGHTGLMLAATFGHFNVVQFLAFNHADLNVQDNNGWTALLWATNNNHTEIVEFLLEQGVDENIQSKLGRTVKDYVDHAHLQNQERLSSIFYSETRSLCRSSSTGSSDGAGTTMTSLTSDSYYVPSLYGVDYRVMCDIVGTTVPAQLQHVTVGTGDDLPPQHVDLNVFINEEDEGLVEFCWDACPPSQMFVFSEGSLDRLLEVAIKKLSNPKVIRSHNNNPAGYTRRPVSANILFLATRYAGYYGSQELVDQLLGGACKLLEHILPPKRHDMMFLGYWLANCSRLLYFLKKDNGLVVPTLLHQVRLNELIQDIFMALIRDAQSRIRGLLDDALLNHDPITNGVDAMLPAYQQDKFVPPSPTTPVDHKGKLISSLRRAFNTSSSDPPPNYLSGELSPPPPLPSSSIPNSLNRLSNYFSATNPPSSPSQTPKSSHPKKPVGKPNPRTITTILSTTVYVLQTFQIHASLVHQAIEQLFFYIGAVCMNRMLARSELCCRWKALLIRMNISQIEDWVQANSIPAPSKDTFTRHLLPVVSLAQLLQIMTNFPSLNAFSEALNESDYLNVIHWSHIRRVMDLYRYEVGESDLSREISSYIVRCADRAFENTAQLKLWLRGVQSDEGEATVQYPQKKQPENGLETDRPIDLSIGQGDEVGDPCDSQLHQEIPDGEMIPPSITDDERTVPMNPKGPEIRRPPPHDLAVQRSNRPSRGPMIQKISKCTQHAYPYLISDEAFWLPFAVPSNVGERVILRILDGEESYIEEAPIISEEIVHMLDNISM